MSLTVLSVAYPLAPVSLDAVGGSEQILALLDRALVRTGHRSIVIAQEGSSLCGTLLAIPAVSGPLDADAKRRAQDYTRQAIRQALCQYPIDLIHLHGLDFAAYLPVCPVPVLTTLHLPPNWYPPEVFQQEGEIFLNCVSAAQQRCCPPTANLLPYIENGVDLERLRPRYRKCGYALALGRICPEKGFHIAI